MFFQTHDRITVSKIESFNYPSHLHNDIEIMICTEGTFGVCCNECEKTLNPGDIMISFPNDIHSYIKTKSGKGIMLIFSHEISEIITSALNNGQYLNFVHDKNVIQIADELYCQNKRHADFSVIYGYLHVIFGMVLKKTNGKKPSFSASSFHSAIRYVSLNYTKRITLQNVAKTVGVSQCHLSRMFSEKIEGGFKNYLNTLRVEKAKNLLKSTELNIYEIFLESGFCDQKTFNRVFKTMTAMTPKEYRLRNK